MSTEMTTADSVADVSEELHLIARSPEDMKVAQQSLIAWVDQKISIMRNDAAEATENASIAADNGWRYAGFDRQAKNAENRVDFYAKIKAALEAGYCIVPNFPVELFAVRTNRKKPDARDSTSEWAGRDAEAQRLPAGEGRYVDTDTIQHQQRRDKIDPQTGLVVLDPQTQRPIRETHYWSEKFRDEIDFPISVAKPEIMSATAEAMALKCFDEIGVLPGRRRKGDPIVVGKILDPRGGERCVSFLVAWYVDTRAL